MNRMSCSLCLIPIRYLLPVFVCGALCAQQPAPIAKRVTVIDFEGLPEGTSVQPHYPCVDLFTLGIATVYPEIVEEGAPTRAFTAGGVADAPLIGSRAMTDPVALGNHSVGVPIRIANCPPGWCEVRFFIIDIDGSETFTATYLPSGTTETHSAGSSATGDGVATEFRHLGPVSSVILSVPPVSGWALDNLAFAEPTLLAPEYEVAVETAQGSNSYMPVGTVSAVVTNASSESWYVHGLNGGDSYNGWLPATAETVSIHLTDTPTGIGFNIVLDSAPNADGGHAEWEVTLVNDPGGAQWGVQDDPAGSPPAPGALPDTYTQNGNTFTSANTWGNCCTDGAVIQGIHYGTHIFFQLTETDGVPATPVLQGIASGVVQSSDGQDISFAPQPGIRVRLVPLGNSPRVSGYQPGGPGTVGFLDYTGLVPGRQYFSVFSFELAPAGPGMGTTFGLHTTNLNVLLGQVQLPPNTPPFNFFPTQATQTEGPFNLPPINVEVLLVELQQVPASPPALSFAPVGSLVVL